MKRAKPYYDEELERAFPLGRRGRAIETLDLLVAPYFVFATLRGGLSDYSGKREAIDLLKSRCLVVTLPHSH